MHQMTDYCPGDRNILATGTENTVPQGQTRSNTGLVKGWHLHSYWMCRWHCMAWNWVETCKQFLTTTVQKPSTSCFAGEIPHCESIKWSLSLVRQEQGFATTWFHNQKSGHLQTGCTTKAYSYLEDVETRFSSFSRSKVWVSTCAMARAFCNSCFSSSACFDRDLLFSTSCTTLAANESARAVRSEIAIRSCISTSTRPWECLRLTAACSAAIRQLWIQSHIPKLPKRQSNCCHCWSGAIGEILVEGDCLREPVFICDLEFDCMLQKLLTGRHSYRIDCGCIPACLDSGWGIWCHVVIWNPGEKTIT